MKSPSLTQNRSDASRARKQGQDQFHATIECGGLEEEHEEPVGEPMAYVLPEEDEVDSGIEDIWADGGESMCPKLEAESEEEMDEEGETKDEASLENRPSLAEYKELTSLFKSTIYDLNSNICNGVLWLSSI